MKSVHYTVVSAVDLLKKVQALPPNEREKFVFALLESEETASSAPIGKTRRVKWPDVEARAKRIFGKRIFPNLVFFEGAAKKNARLDSFLIARIGGGKWHLDHHQNQRSSFFLSTTAYLPFEYLPKAIWPLQGIPNTLGAR
jgi:hypothetical protein